MSRHTIVRLFILPPLAVIALSLWTTTATHAASSTDFKFDVKISDERLERVRCDGTDSIPFSVRITRVADGSPVVGATVVVITNPSDAPRESVTNRGGMARGVVLPPAAAPGAYPWRVLVISAVVDGAQLSYGPRAYSCPFPAGDYGLSVHAFVDRNGDGAQELREPDFARREFTLSLSGRTWISTLQNRLYNLDARGDLNTTLFTGGWSAQETWSICLTDRDVARGWQIVAANGAPLESPYRCATLPQLATGPNNVTIGVTRTHSE